MSGHFVVGFLNRDVEKEYQKLDGSQRRLVRIAVAKLKTRADEIGTPLHGELAADDQDAAQDSSGCDSDAAQNCRQAVCQSAYRTDKPSHGCRARYESPVRSIRPTVHRYDRGQESKAIRGYVDGYQKFDHSWPYYEPHSPLHSSQI